MLVMRVVSGVMLSRAWSQSGGRRTNSKQQVGAEYGSWLEERCDTECVAVARQGQRGALSGSETASLPMGCKLRRCVTRAKPPWAVAEPTQLMVCTISDVRCLSLLKFVLCAVPVCLLALLLCCCSCCAGAVPEHWC